MITSKQRAYLRGLANEMEAIYQIGKTGVNPEVTNGISEALEARELIKINILKNCFEDPKEIATIISERTHSMVVQLIGRKIVLYRPAKKPIIELPK